MTNVELICAAIRTRSLLEFIYDNRRRVVAPYCCGVSTRGGDVLRAIQVRGESASGGLGFGKLWSVEKIADLSMLQETFVADDPNYKRNDSAMITIYCEIQR